jgi:sterol desaturase/sphingolipid hydroxylase (fatty acid hydroxylase superfamily)
MKNEVFIRAACFIFVFILIVVWELLAPRRALTTSKTTRWVSNLGITFLNPLILHLLFPVLAVGMAIWAHESGWGLLNIMELPSWLSLIIGVAILDLVIYFPARHISCYSLTMAPASDPPRRPGC